jgi:serine/threonine protein kinase
MGMGMGMGMGDKTSRRGATCSELLSNYRLGPVLDSGAFVSVRMAWPLSLPADALNRDNAVAVKSYDKKKILSSKNAGEIRHLEQDMALIGKLHHKNVVAMHTKYETDDEVHLVMEYCSGGSLASHLEKFSKKGGKITMAKVWSLFKQVADGLHYLHQRNICHRDIKLENCVVANDANENQNQNQGEQQGELVKLVDFGLGARTDAKACSTICGSPEYMAPELVAGIDKDGRATRIKYDGKPVDVWSMGVLLYVLVTGGRFPFAAHNIQALYSNIKRGVFSRGREITPVVSKLLDGMLCKDPKRRMTMGEIVESLKHINDPM